MTRMTWRRRVAPVAVAILVVAAIAAHALLLFRLSERLVVPLAAAAIALMIAMHLGAGRWLLHRRRSTRERG